MKLKSLLVAGAALFASAALVSTTSTSAQAVGCLSGAVAGGVAGHMAGHGVLGAIGGCVAGHELKKAQKKKKLLEEQQMQQQQTVPVLGLDGKPTQPSVPVK